MPILFILAVLLAPIAANAQTAPVPAFYPNQFYDAKQLGVDCSGSTDSAAALQAGINAIPDGSTIFFQQRCNVLLGSTISITDRFHLRLAAFIQPPNGGESPQAPAFTWNGSGGAMFDVEHSDHPTFEGFMFKVAGGKSVDTFLNFDGNPGTHIGTAALVNDNDFQGPPSNPNFVAVAISRTATQNHENYRIINNSFSCSGSEASRVSTNGAITAGSSNLDVSPDTPFSSANVGNPIWVSYKGGLLLTTISSVTNSSQIVLASNADATETGAQVNLGQSYGIGIYLGPSQNALQEQFLDNTFVYCHYAIYGANGSFQASHVGGGYGDWGIYIDNAVQNESIDYYESEQDMRGIVVKGTQIAPVTITNTRLSNGNQLADGFLKLGGPVTLIDSESIAFPSAINANGVLVGVSACCTSQIISIGNSFENASWGVVGYDQFVDWPVQSIADYINGAAPGLNTFGCVVNATSPCLSVGGALAGSGGVGFNANTYTAWGADAGGTTIQATSQLWYAPNYIGIESVGDSGRVTTSQKLFAADYPAITDVSAFTGSGMYGFYANSPNTVVGGTLPNLYGIYVAPQLKTNVTNGWGVYQAGTADQNYFAGNTVFGGGVSLAASVVSELPTCGSATTGTMRYVTDSVSSPVYNAPAVGGGSLVIPVFCNGTQWTNH
jgi:hypothetical protein